MLGESLLKLAVKRVKIEKVNCFIPTEVALFFKVFRSVIAFEVYFRMKTITSVYYFIGLSFIQQITT